MNKINFTKVIRMLGVTGGIFFLLYSVLVGGMYLFLGITLGGLEWGPMVGCSFLVLLISILEIILSLRIKENPKFYGTVLIICWVIMLSFLIWSALLIS